MKIILWFISVLISAAVLFLLLERRDTSKSLRIKTCLSVSEVYEGDCLFYTEVIENQSIIPVRSVRIDTILPNGLEFVIEKRSGVNTISEHMFLGPHRQIERVWKIRAVRRGCYIAYKVRIIAASMIGSTSFSCAAESVTLSENKLTVLPSSISIESHFRYNGNSCDEEALTPKLTTDPIIKSAPRDYTPQDPFRSINWKLSAVHGRMLVNTEQPFESRELNLLLNIQSRPWELHELTPSSPDYTELAVTVAASLINALYDTDTPLTITTNAKCASSGEDRVHLDDERHYTVTPRCSSRIGLLSQLEMLAGIENELTCSAPQMLTDLSRRLDERLTSANNLIVVSPYFDAAMAEFHREVSALHIPIVYYLVCGRNDTDRIPSDAKIYYYTYK